MASSSANRTRYKQHGLKSWVWNHFSLIKEDKTVAVCDICSDELKYASGSTSVLGKHLTRKHSLSSATGPTSSNMDDESDIDIQEITTPARQATIERFLPQKPLDANSKKHREITELLANLVVKDLQPFSIVEDKGMRDLIKYFEPRYQMVCRSTLTSRVETKYETAAAALKDKIDASDAIALTTDGWTSRSGEDYNAMTVHLLTKWKLETYLLAVSRFDQNHTAVNLTNFIKGAVEKWIVLPADDTPLYVTTDNAANIVRGKHLTMFRVTW